MSDESQASNLIHHVALIRIKGDDFELLGQQVTTKGDPNTGKFKAKVAELIEKFSKSTKKMTAPMSIKSSPKDEDYDIQMWCASFNDVLFLFMAFLARDFGSHHLPDELRAFWIKKFNDAVPPSDANGSKGSLERRAGDILRRVVEQYNTSSLLNAKQKVNVLTNKMKDNVDLAMANVDKMDELDVKSAEIEEASRTFKDNTAKVKCAMCKSYYKSMLIIALIVIVVIVVIVVIATQK